MPLLGDQIAPGLALLLIVGGAVVSCAVAAFLLARADLATVLGSWWEGLSIETGPVETGPKMQARPRADAGAQATAPAAGAAPEFGFVESSRLAGRNAPRPPAAAAPHTAAMVASRIGPAAGFSSDLPSGSGRDAGAPDGSANAAETIAPTAAAGAEAADVPVDAVAEPAAVPAEPALPAVPAAEDDGTAACPPPIVLGFPRNSLVPASRDLNAAAADLSAWLRRLPRASVVIEGHTDSLGSDDVNRAVSEQRARAIADLLIRLGLPADRIIVRGLGESRLLPAFGPTAAQQRRVVLRLDGSAGCGAEPGGDPAP